MKINITLFGPSEILFGCRIDQMMKHRIVMQDGDA